MSGEVVGVLAGLTIVGSLNVAILVFVFTISREMGSLGTRVDHLEQGLTTAIDGAVSQLETRLDERIGKLERRVTKRSTEIHALVEETKRLGLLVAKALDLPPDALDDQ